MGGVEGGEAEGSPGEPAAAPLAAAALDPVPGAVGLVDDVTIVGWNKAAETLYGHGAAEVVGQPLADVLFDPADAPGVLRTLEAVRGGRRREGDARVRRADGVLAVSRFRATPVPGGDRTLVAWIASDRSERGLAEQERAVLLVAERAARASAEEALGLVEAVLDSAPVGIAVFDLELRYVRVNSAFAGLSGVSEQDHIGGYAGQVVPLPPEVSADLRRVVTTGRRILDRSAQLDLDGEERHFRLDYYPVRTSAGALVGAGVTVLEVTGAKRAEQERIGLLASAETARRRLAVLASASAALSVTMDLDVMLQRLARSLAPSTADWCVIELFEPGGTVTNAGVAHRNAGRARALRDVVLGGQIDLAGTGPVARVLRTGQGRRLDEPHLSATVTAAATDPGQPELAGSYQLRSSLVAPLWASGLVAGVLILSSETEELSDDDLDLAVEVAHRGSLAVSNAQAFQREHAIAEKLQQGLLPASLPAVAGATVAVRYLAATAGALVGGDWYDVIAIDDTAAVLCVGDVVGHNIEAASAMGQLRAGLRFYAYEERDRPSTVLGRLDRLVDQLGLPMATCLLAVFERTGPTLTWSSAGHPPPLLMRGGDARFLTGSSGALLGAGVTSTDDHVVELRAGDVVILYTDGLVERRGESLDVGLERLRRTAAASRAAAPSTEERSPAAAARALDAICDGILLGLLPRDERRPDDVAVLAVHVAGDP